MQGHIRRRKSSWELVFDLGPDPATGRRRQRFMSVRGSKKQAQAKLREILTSVDRGNFVELNRGTVGGFLRWWLREYANANVRPRTAEGYAHKIERHLIPGLGAIPLAQLRPSHLQMFYRKALGEGRLDGKGGLSAQSVLHLHRILSKALSHAVRWGLLSRNVCSEADPPRPELREMRTLDDKGVLRFLDVARDTVYYTLFLLAIHTGLRRSEILGLRWKNVDMDMVTLSVVQVMHRLRDGRNVFQQPKTAKGRRIVALTPTAVLALRAHREQQEAERAFLEVPSTGDSLVFSHPDGSPLLPNTVTHAFIKIARRAGLRGIRLHDLRHTHASLLLRQGVHPKIVSERLGHANIAVTLDTYSHVLPGLQEAAARQFDEGLQAARPTAQQAKAS